jgi:hypothetical protein
MDVAHAQTVADLRRRALAVDRAEQRLEVERLRPAAGELLLEARPDHPGTVGGELDAVAVGVGQVDRLVGPVVGHALDRRPGLDQARGGAGELLAAGVEQRVVVEAGVTAGRSGLGILMEHDDGLVTVPNLGLRVVAPVQPQAERALVPADRPIEIGHGQMNVAEPKLRRKDMR